MKNNPNYPLKPSLYHAIDKREPIILEALLNMVQGNFYQRMQLSDSNDFLSAVMFLINKICEESHAYFMHQSFVPVLQDSESLAPIIFYLNAQGLIESVNTYAVNALNQEKEAMIRQAFVNFLTEGSKKTWIKSQERTIPNNEVEYMLRLDLKITEGLLLSNIFFVHVIDQGPKDHRKSIVWTVLYSPKESLGKKIWQEENSGKRIKQKKLKLARKDVELAKDIHKLISDDLQRELPSTKSLAKKYGTNEYRLKVIFKFFYKMPIFTYQRHQRLLEARRLILDSNLKIQSIAGLVGFKNVSHFHKVFKQEMGQTPYSLRKSNKKEK